MSEASSKSSQATLLDTINATGSPASPDGHTRSTSPDGAIAKSGPAPVRVSRFRARDSGRAMPTNDTSGPLFTASSPSAALQRSLESRLQARMDVNGSPEYALTWKIWDMPSGPPICALRASGRRTLDNGCSGWPTPQSFDANEIKSSPEALVRRRSLGGCSNLREVVHVSGWPTPMAGSPATDTYNEAGNTDSGRKTVALVAGWPSPKASNTTGAGTRGEGGDNLQTAATLSGWATPSARDWKNGQASQDTMDRNARPLNEQAVMLSGWPTPCSQDGPNGGPNQGTDRLPGAAQLGSPASTEKRGGCLNPFFSGWLQGFPTAWTNCALRIVRRSRKASRIASASSEGSETP